MNYAFKNGVKFSEFFKNNSEYQKAINLFKKGLDEEQIVNEILCFRENRLMVDNQYLEWVCFKNQYNYNRIIKFINWGLSIKNAIKLEQDFVLNEKKLNI